MPLHDPVRLLRRLDAYCAHALEAAASLAQTRAHAEILPEHWLIKLLEPGDGDLPLLIRFAELEMDKLWQGLLTHLDGLPHALRGKPGLSRALQQWLEAAWMLASLEEGETQIRSLHLLLVLQDQPQLIRTADAWPLLVMGRSWIEQKQGQLARYSVEANAVTATPQATATEAAENAGPAETAAPAMAEVLQRFTIDLTAKARAGQIDPVSGRDAEIRQMIDILSRRRKNNPILVGDPGVGKTALVEGLALRIVEGQVPAALRHVHLLVLDLGLLQAGAGVKGEFEQRLKNVIDAVQASPAPVLLFIDEAHTLIGAGNSAGGADAANLLKPALARGELRTIAATTWSEYKQYFERDAALERRFQMVKVEEPDDPTACQMLRGLQTRYAQYHGVHVRDDAVVAAVQLSRRYLTGRQLPDKAADLIDTAAARVRVSLEAEPVQIDHLRARLAALETEKNALLGDQRAGLDGLSARLEGLQQEHDETATALEQMLAAHAAQHDLVQQIHAAGASEDDTARQASTAVRAALGDLQKHQPALVHPEVNPAVVANVVADWTGIPLETLMKDEHTSLLELEARLTPRVIGQDEALAQLAASLRTARTGLRTTEGPTGVFLLVGPSGVGKTETALALSDLLFGGERAMVTINLSEYQEAHTVSQLKGSPPGYVGYGQGGVLTEAVRRHPYCVVLLDEVEKAHRDVLNLFYQVFDRGFMRDGEGREIDFRNTVILMTSNLGSEQMMALGEGEAQLTAAELDAAIRPILVEHFQPALLARFQTIYYRPLGQATLAQIARLKLDKVAERLSRHYHCGFDFDDAVCEGIAACCQVGDSGARAVGHLLDQQLLPEMSRALLQWQAEQGQPPARVSLRWDEETAQPVLALEQD